MKIPFTKLHGAKNDFLLTRVQDAPEDNLPELAVAICNRYTGVGADGWMLIDTTASEGYHAAIRLFNSDGSEPELSGNGTRCAAALIARGQPGMEEIRIRTGAGVKQLKLLSVTGDEYLFEMNMGAVAVVEERATVQGRDAVLVNPGNPQCVFLVDSFDFHWQALGRQTEFDARFPNRTNVSFVRRVNDHEIEVRFWERGAGETMSSGTGSTGAAAGALARGLVKSPVEVATPAGSLQLRFEGATAYLTGPAEFVAEGVYFETLRY